MTRSVRVRPVDTINGWPIPPVERLRQLGAVASDDTGADFRISSGELFGLVLCAALLRHGYTVEIDPPAAPPREYAAVREIVRLVDEQVRTGRKPRP